MGDERVRPEGRGRAAEVAASCGGRMSGWHGPVRSVALLAGCLAGLRSDHRDQRGDVIAPERVVVAGELIGIDVAGVAQT